MFIKLNILKNDKHLEKLVRLNKEYSIAYLVDEETYNNIDVHSYIIIGSYKGEDVYGYIERKDTYPPKLPSDMNPKLIERFIRVWIMATTKLELKKPMLGENTL